MKKLSLILIFVFAIIVSACAAASANQSYSPDSWSNGISDSAIENLPDADHPFVIQCGPFKNREEARTAIYGLATELGMPGYFHLVRTFTESPKDNKILVRVGRFATREEAMEKFAAVKKSSYAGLSVVEAYSTADQVVDATLLDAIYQEFDEGSRYIGRFVLSCTPQVPDSAQRFVSVSQDGMEVSVPIHLDRISSNANQAVRRIRNGEHMLVRDAEVRFDDSLGCYVIKLAMKRKVEIARVRQYAPILVIDLEKLPN